MSVTKLKTTEQKHDIRLITITPEEAVTMLECNTLNRPLVQSHVDRIARQITGGKWKFNGDTIKIAEGGDIVDGQHRLWAVVEAKAPIETIVVRGVPHEAFCTIDTLRRPRSGGDILALNGVTRRAKQVAAALAWLLRWQRGHLPRYQAPDARVENSDIEECYAHHHAMVAAVDRVVPAVKGLGSGSLLAFVYYVLASRDEALADRMLQTLENPAGVAVNDPFFRFRVYLTSDANRRREPVVTVALAFKAANAAKADKKIETLSWKHQGDHAEAFPELFS